MTDGNTNSPGTMLAVDDSNADWTERYRPQNIDDMVLPSDVQQMMLGFVKAEFVPHLFIFGTAGTGKTSLVRALAEGLDADLYSVNAAQDRSIRAFDQVFEFASGVAFNGKRKLASLEEMDKVLPAAQSVLREKMESFAGNCAFLMTANSAKVDGPLLNRCTVVNMDAAFERDKETVLKAQIDRARFIVQREGGKVDDQTVTDIVTDAYPSFRRALRELQTASATGLRSLPYTPVAAKAARKKGPVAGPKKKESIEAPAESAPSAAVAASRDGVELLSGLSSAFAEYVICSPPEADAVALFVLHTHLMDAAQHASFLCFMSAEPRSAKTTSLRFLQHVCANALLTSEISMPGFTTAIGDGHSTILFDEFEHSQSGRASALLRILNASHTRGTQRVTANGASGLFAAKAIGLIGTPAPTLFDRSIPIRLHRKLVSEKTRQFRDDQINHLVALQKRCTAFANAHFEALKAADPAIPDGLSDRAADNWRPLLAIADLVGADWPERARQAAQFVHKDTAADEPSPGVVILTAAHEYFTQEGSDRIRSRDLVKLAAEAGFSLGGGLAGMRRIARILKNYGIDPGTHRFASGPEKGYLRPDMEAAFARYVYPRLSPTQSVDVTDVTDVTVTSKE